MFVLFPGVMTFEVFLGINIWSCVCWVGVSFFGYRFPLQVPASMVAVGSDSPARRGTLEIPGRKQCLTPAKYLGVCSLVRALLQVGKKMG